MSSSTHRAACQSILSQLFGEGIFECDVDLGVSSPYSQISSGVSGTRMISKTKVKFLLLIVSRIFRNMITSSRICTLIIINDEFQTFYFILLFPVFALLSCSSLWPYFTITSQHPIQQVNNFSAFCSYEAQAFAWNHWNSIFIFIYTLLWISLPLKWWRNPDCSCHSTLFMFNVFLTSMPPPLSISRSSLLFFICNSYEISPKLFRAAFLKVPPFWCWFPLTVCRRSHV